MVLPAMFGCDTTSYSHLIVQTLVLGQWASLRRQMDGFKDPGSTHEQIHEAGLKTMAARCSTDQNCFSEKLNEAREIQFHKKCSSKSAKMGVNLTSLVLSEHSVYLHLGRIFKSKTDKVTPWSRLTMGGKSKADCWSPSICNKTLYLSASWR